ncbi:MAG TPA: TraB/GumN family protein [Lysobacter sp.]
MSTHRLKNLGLPLLAAILVSGGLLSAGAIAGKQLHTSPAVAATGVAPSAKAPPVPLLWKVSDQDNAVYLLGSFHLLKVDDYPLSTDIDQAFASADRIVFEVPPSELADPATAQKIQAAAGYGDARTLTTVLPAVLREKLGRLLGADGSIAKLDAYEPWFVNLSLMLGMSQAMGFQPDQGLDQHLMARAATAGKPVAGLETIDAQLKLLDSSPLPEQIKGLQDFLDNPTEMPGKLTELHDAWRNGDVAKLGQIAIEEMREKTPETYQLINVQRNDAWLPQVSAMLDAAKTGDTLVVVGALHLLGDDGIVEKLRGKGYTVERICSACAVAKQ